MKVLKFGAVWCPGCLVMRPRWQEIEKENPWLATEYYDIDDSPEMAAKYSITKDIPVFVFLDKDGTEILRLKGEVDKDKLVAAVNEHRDK
jgi:thiol-disulfide isomerase/thioredoxin